MTARCERCGKHANDRHYGLCCACVEHEQEVQDGTEARHMIVIDAARDVGRRVPGATRRLRAALALRDGDALRDGLLARAAEAAQEAIGG